MQLTCEPTSTYISNTSSTISNQQDVRLTHEPPSTYTSSIRSIQQNAVNKVSFQFNMKCSKQVNLHPYMLQVSTKFNKTCS